MKKILVLAAILLMIIYDHSSAQLGLKWSSRYGYNLQDIEDGETSQSSVAQVGINLGTEYGFGPLFQVGSHRTKLELGAGLMPLFVIWQIAGYESDMIFKFYLSGNFGAKLNLGLNRSEKFRVGLKFGVNYDTIMKAGFGGGADFTLAPKAKKTTITVGFMYYPSAYDELFSRLEKDDNRDYQEDETSSAMVGFRIFLGVTLFFGQ